MIFSPREAEMVGPIRVTTMNVTVTTDTTESEDVRNVTSRLVTRSTAYELECTKCGWTAMLNRLMFPSVEAWENVWDLINRIGAEHCCETSDEDSEFWLQIWAADLVTEAVTLIPSLTMSWGVLVDEYLERLMEPLKPVGLTFPKIEWTFDEWGAALGTLKPQPPEPLEKSEQERVRDTWTDGMHVTARRVRDRLHRPTGRLSSRSPVKQCVPVACHPVWGPALMTGRSFHE